MKSQKKGIKQSLEKKIMKMKKMKKERKRIEYFGTWTAEEQAKYLGKQFLKNLNNPENHDKSN